MGIPPFPQHHSMTSPGPVVPVGEMAKGKQCWLTSPPSTYIQLRPPPNLGEAGNLAFLGAQVTPATT